MPPLYRIDVGKNVYYALDEAEKKGVLDRIEAEKIRGKRSRASVNMSEVIRIGVVLMTTRCSAKFADSGR